MSFKENHNLSIAIFFDNDYFLTGDVLKGVLELNVKDEINLSLREICVELAGFEGNIKISQKLKYSIYILMYLLFLLYSYLYNLC